LPPPPGFLEPYVDRRRSDGRPQSLLAAYRKFQTPRDVLRTGDYSDRIGPRQADLQAILQEAARVCATCLGAPFSKIWRYRPSEDDLLVVAGRGWNLGVVGFATSVADETSPQGRAFITGNPQVCANIEKANAFTLPSFIPNTASYRRRMSWSPPRPAHPSVCSK
jgi:hypothetical protein